MISDSFIFIIMIILFISFMINLIDSVESNFLEPPIIECLSLIFIIKFFTVIISEVLDHLSPFIS